MQDDTVRLHRLSSVVPVALALVVTYAGLYWLMFRVLPLPSDLASVTYLSTIGASISSVSVGFRLSRRVGRVTGLGNRVRETRRILGRSSRFLIGWLGIGWGAAATWTSWRARLVAAGVGGLLVAAGHVVIERRVRRALGVGQQESGGAG